MAVTTVHEDPAYSRAYPARWSCRIEIETRSGQKRVGSVEHFKGHPDNPMTDAELEDKFRALAAPRLDRASCDAILATTWALETLTDIGELIDLLRW